jgi:lipopolysaccharide export system protein LptA
VILRLAFSVILPLLIPAALWAQGANIAFGGLEHDPAQAVEVSADQLSVDQAAGTAIFAGNVVIAQGKLRLAAARVEVVYSGANDGGISRLLASGGVTFVAGSEAAEAREATYDLAGGTLIMSGNVVLTQGSSALSGDNLTIDLEDGTGVMDGRVRSVFRPSGN